MNEILHANIFFVIASIATVVFCILVSMALYQVIKILQSIRAIIDRIEAESERIAADVTHVRELIASGGILSRAMSYLASSFLPRPKRKQRSRSED